MNRKEFLKILKKLEKKYGSFNKRLAADGWDSSWKTLIATILSAQSRDETTIPIAENLFKKYNSLERLSRAKNKDVFKILKSINYNRTKTKNVINASKYILENYKGKIPDNMEDLIKIPGVGRKTANLVLTEVHDKDGITVDTHVHRLSNVLGLVKTKNPTETEFALMKVIPRKHWYRINRLFVLWGKEIRGRDKNKFLKSL